MGIIEVKKHALRGRKRNINMLELWSDVSYLKRVVSDGDR